MTQDEAEELKRGDLVMLKRGDLVMLKRGDLVMLMQNNYHLPLRVVRFDSKTKHVWTTTAVGFTCSFRLDELRLPTARELMLLSSPPGRSRG